MDTYKDWLRDEEAINGKLTENEKALTRAAYQAALQEAMMAIDNLVEEE
jgi:hypothetical protein